MFISFTIYSRGNETYPVQKDALLRYSFLSHFMLAQGLCWGRAQSKILYLPSPYQKASNMMKQSQENWGGNAFSSLLKIIYTVMP